MTGMRCARHHHFKASSGCFGVASRRSIGLPRTAGIGASRPLALVPAEVRLRRLAEVHVEIGCFRFCPKAAIRCVGELRSDMPRSRSSSHRTQAAQTGGNRTLLSAPLATSAPNLPFAMLASDDGFDAKQLGLSVPTWAQPACSG